MHLVEVAFDFLDVVVPFICNENRKHTLNDDPRIDNEPRLLTAGYVAKSADFRRDLGTGHAELLFVVG